MVPLCRKTQPSNRSLGVEYFFLFNPKRLFVYRLSYEEFPRIQILEQHNTKEAKKVVHTSETCRFHINVSKIRMKTLHYVHAQGGLWGENQWFSSNNTCNDHRDRILKRSLITVKSMWNKIIHTGSSHPCRRLPRAKKTRRIPSKLNKSGVEC